MFSKLYFKINMFYYFQLKKKKTKQFICEHQTHYAIISKE